MDRQFNVQQVIIGDDADGSGSNDIDMRNAAGGRILIPSGSTITSLTWLESHDGETFVSCYDADGNAVSQVVAAGRSYPIPDAVFASGILRAVGDADGTIHVTRKS